jgi:hypothetical protein
MRFVGINILIKCDVVLDMYKKIQMERKQIYKNQAINY